MPKADPSVVSAAHDPRGMVKLSPVEHPKPPLSTGTGDKIRIGFFSFTEITDPAAHGAYNAWHQLDHLPEQLPLAGVAWGQRWVSTPACREARAVAGTRLAPIHYMTLYLMTDPVPETLAAFARLGEQLRRQGRFFSQRHSHLSGPFDAVAATAARRVLISAAAVPYRPGTGVYVVVDEATTDEPDDADEWRRPPDHEQLVGVDGVAGVWSFASHRGGEGRWRPGRYRITVCYLDDDPLEVSARLWPVLASDGAGPGSSTIFAGPFETVVPWRWDFFDGEALPQSQA